MALVVVAEDDGDIREIMERVLRRAGHTVVAAGDGAAGLAAVRERRPDLVVSDIDMPVMSGIEMTLALRGDPATEDLPVLFVSGSVAPGDPGPAAVEGTSVLFKPFLPAELTAAVDQALHAGRAAGPG
ncbi:response regulator [Actinoplanes sp. N902-109]|uniref:response regulator n=1 Tax=Actinoplanes sp. (strain N902-109) TaxID=649831 RepID=UPI000329438A|nr:response regulator [Actinoplanes sp. N902-109]AGL16546.1 response regulator receiver protein [Actinoplanes sp. N902-109]